MLDPRLIVFTLSLLPITERVAIPAGKILKLDINEAFFYAMLGTFVAMSILLLILKPTIDFILNRIEPLKKLVNRVLDHTQKKHSAKFNEIGSLIILLVVSIPLPGTGPYTGALIAYLYNIKYWKALGLIMLGALISSLLIAGGTVSVSHTIEFLKLFER